MFTTSPLKCGLVAYLGVAMVLVLWQLYAHDFLGSCQFGAGGCVGTLRDFGYRALLWPWHLILWKAL